MNPAVAFLTGIAPEHVPALLAGLLLPLVVYGIRRLRLPSRAELGYAPNVRPEPSTVARWAAWLLGEAAVVHLALPLGHHDSPLLTVGFLVSGAAFAWLAMRVLEGRSWRTFSALLLVATLLAYAIISATGTEEADQVGILTAMLELAALGLCLVPAREPQRRLRVARFAGSTGTVAVTLLIGVIVWAGSFAAHNASNTQSPQGDAAANPVGHNHAQGHAHVARAQAGVVMRAQPTQVATAAQEIAAARLAADVIAATARFTDPDAAVAAGYAWSGTAEGNEVHLENKAYTHDGRVLDPQRPESLVYAVSGGKATLLGVLFQLERAGVPGPEPGGPITRWHAHNACITALPPGFGIVSAFGSCPALSISITSPEMMHVWVVPNPGGAFADGLDDTFVRAYHAAHGVSYTAR